MISRLLLILELTALTRLTFHALRLVSNLILFLNIRILLKIFSEVDLENVIDTGFGITRLQPLNRC